MYSRENALRRAEVRRDAAATLRQTAQAKREDPSATSPEERRIARAYAWIAELDAGHDAAMAEIYDRVAAGERVA